MMSYTNRIAVLQESLKLLEKRISEIDKSQDNQVWTEAIQQKITLEREISRLQKLDWEEKYERLDLDEDR
jgi:hypothetical protein